MLFTEQHQNKWGDTLSSIKQKGRREAPRSPSRGCCITSWVSFSCLWTCEPLIPHTSPALPLQRMHCRPHQSLQREAETIQSSFYALSQIYSRPVCELRSNKHLQRLYWKALLAVHKLAGESSIQYRILCREGVMGCLCRHCSNITVINAAFHPSQRRKVLKLPLVLLLMHQPVWPNCGSSQARKLLAETVINYPIPLSWNRNWIRAFNV